MNVCKYVHRTKIIVLNYFGNTLATSYLALGVIALAEKGKRGHGKIISFSYDGKVTGIYFFAFSDWATNYRWKPEHAHRRLIRLSGLD